MIHAIKTVFEKFDELGSARQVFHWWSRQDLKYPVRHLRSRIHPVAWLTPKYAMLLRTLRNPIQQGPNGRPRLLWQQLERERPLVRGPIFLPRPQKKHLHVLLQAKTTVIQFTEK